MPENYMHPVFLSLPPLHLHTQSSHALLLSIYPGCLHEAGEHICTASCTCSSHQALLQLMAKKVSVQGVGGEKMKNIWQSNGINISSTV